jgi:hypothetical protein
MSVGKTVPSSSNICPEACCRKGWGLVEVTFSHSPVTTTLKPSWSVDILYKDDVTVYIFPCVFFIYSRWVYFSIHSTIVFCLLLRIFKEENAFLFWEEESGCM